LIALDRNGVTFRWKDYRRDGCDRFRTMTLAMPAGSLALDSSSSPIKASGLIRQATVAASPTRSPAGARLISGVRWA
jgi:hypothetical protein